MTTSQDQSQQNQSKMDDELTDKYIQDKLIYKDNILKSIIKKYCELMSPEIDDKQGPVPEEIISDIQMYEFQIAKAQRTIQTQTQDRHNLTQLHEKILKKVKSSQKDIQELKEDYEVEEQIKNNKLCYETLSHQVVQYDDQNVIEKKIETIIQVIGELKNSHSQKMKKIKEKEKHLSLLLHTMRELNDDDL